MKNLLCPYILLFILKTKTLLTLTTSDTHKRNGQLLLDSPYSLCLFTIIQMTKEKNRKIQSISTTLPNLCMSTQSHCPRGWLDISTVQGSVNTCRISSSPKASSERALPVLMSWLKSPFSAADQSLFSSHAIAPKQQILTLWTTLTKLFTKILCYHTRARTVTRLPWMVTGLIVVNMVRGAVWVKITARSQWIQGDGKWSSQLTRHSSPLPLEHPWLAAFTEVHITPVERKKYLPPPST